MAEVFKVYYMVNGAGYHTVDLILSPWAGDEIGLRFPAPGVNLWHEQRQNIARRVDESAVRAALFPKPAVGKIFRFVGRFGLPMHNF